MYVYTGQQVDLGYGRGWLNAPAAASVRRIDAQIGHAMQITEAGRTYAQQMAHWLNYLKYGYPIALNPDTPSLHQVGNAVDSNEAQRILAVMADNGWRRTVYRYVNGVWTLVEPWHFEYFPQNDNHKNDPAGGGAVPLPIPTPVPEEEDDMSWKPIIFSRGGGLPFDGTMAHPDLGLDETNLGTVTLPNGKVIVTHRGWIVTDDEDTYKRWAQMYYPGIDINKFAPPGSDTDKKAFYEGMQAEAERVSLEVHGDAPKA